MKNIYSKTSKSNFNRQRFFSLNENVLKKISSILLFAFLLYTSSGNVWGQAQSSSYTTAGTYQWLCPPNVTSITVKCYGAGGGGGRGYTTNGAAGGGGGGGAYASSTISVSPGTIYEVVVGAGGTSPTNNNGNPGGNSSFGGTIVVAQGGRGGTQATTNTGGAGGAGGSIASSTGDSKNNGGAGATGISGTGNTGVQGGGGGGAVGNEVGTGATATTKAGATGTNPTSTGGSGNRNAVGGAGTGIGAGGAGGNRNTSNRVGGTGAAGAVIIEWTGAPPSTSVNMTSLNNTTSTTLTSNAFFYDNGGPSSNYNGSPGTTIHTFYPIPGHTIQVEFISYALENCDCDYLSIFNGNSVSEPLIGTWANSNPGTRISTAADGSMTFRLVTDINTSAAGWYAVIRNVPRPAAPQALGNINFGPVASANGTALRGDANITAATCWTGCIGGNHEAWRGRLFNRGPGTTAWASGDNVIGTNYLQFDLGATQSVVGVATQSRMDCCPGQRVTSYTIWHSVNGVDWTQIPGTFNGNSTENIVVTNNFTSVNARYIRLFPQGYNSHMSMRADIITLPCAGSNVSMSADITDNANTVRWYTTPTGGTPIHTGQYYTAANVSSNTTFYAEAFNSSTGLSSSTRTAVVASVYSPTVSNNSSQAICGGSSVVLSGNNPSPGTGVWSVVSGPNTNPSQFSNTGIFNSTFTPSGGNGDYVVRWTVTQNGCSLSADATIQFRSVQGNPAVFGSNTWNVYAYNGQNRDDLSALTYLGFYTQNLGSQQGFNTTAAWNNTLSPSVASGYQGCIVPNDVFTFVHKRQGFTPGYYSIQIDNWDDESILYINGTSVWQAGVWSGNPAHGFSVPHNQGCLYFDANTTMEFRTAEGSGGANAQITMTPSTGPTNASAGFDAAVCSGGSTQLNASATAPTLSIPNNYGTSCANNSGDTYIRTVTLNGVTTTNSNDAACTNNTSVVINLNQGTAYTLTIVTADNGGNAYTHGVTAYIDYNRDGDFLDANEKIGTTTSEVSVGTRNFNFTVPSNLVGGDCMLRIVASEDSGDPSSTGNYSYGETEDYTIRIPVPVTYSWSPATFLSATNVPNPTASNVTSAQTYTMTATSNGCSIQQTVNVSVRSIPAATASNSGPVCAGGTVNLTASSLAPGGQVVSMSNNSSDNIVGTTHSGVLNNHTMEFWVNPNRTVVLHAEQNTGVSGNLSAPTTEYSFAISPNQFGGSGCTPANVGVGISVGTNGIEVVQHGPCHFPVTLSYAGSISGWTHVAVVHISNVPYLYINGNLVKVGLSSVYPTFPNSSVSMNYGYFGGSIDNIRVWNLSRTASQIVADMNREVPSVATGLIHNLPLNGNGTALTGANATVNGSTYTTPTFYTYTWSGLNAPTASTNETQASGNTTGGNYTVLATSAGCSGTASAATTVSVTNPTVTTTVNVNDFVWTGAVSTAWNTRNNWLQWNGSSYDFPAAHPNSSGANVILPTDAGGTCVPREARIGNYTITVNNLAGETNHNLQLNNANAILNIHGTYQGGGWSTPTAGATVNFIGNNDQPIRTGTYSNLTTGGSGIKTLTGGNVTVNLNCTVGANTTLALDNRTLTLPNPGTPLVLTGSLNAGTGTVTYSSTTGDQNITPATYYNLTTSGNPSVKALTGTTTVTNIVNIGAGVTFNAGSHTLNLPRLTNAPFTITAPGTFNAGTGTVDYNGGGAQAVNALTYHNLTISGSGTKTLAAGTTTVNGTLNLVAGTFAVAARTLVLNGPYITGTVANMTTLATSTLELNCTGAGPFTLHSSTALGNLKINSSGQVYNLNSNMTISGNLDLEAGTLGVNTRNFTYSGSNITRTSGLIDATNATGTMIFANTVPLTLPANIFTSSSIGKLTLNGAGGVSLGSNTTVSNTLALTNGTLTVGPNTLTMNGSTLTKGVSAGFIDASDASATLAFGNAALLTLPANVFSAAVNNMSLSGTRVKASSDFTVNGTLSLNAANPDATNGLLDLVNAYGSYGNNRTADNTDANNNLNSVVLTLGPDAVVSGQGDVTGKIRRTSFVNNTSYAFGHENMRLSFDENGGTLPSQITVVATKGVEGLHVDKNGTHDTGPDGLIGGAAVQRMWQVLKTGGTNEVRFTVRFPYLDSELNGNNEANLVTWDHHIPYGGMTPHEHGKTSNNTTENWVELSNHGIGYLATENDTEFTKYWMLSQKVSADTLWLGASGGGAGINWNVGINWSHGVVPTDFTKVVVDPSIYNNALTINGNYQAGAMEIKEGGVVNGGSGTITLNGGAIENGGSGTWINNGRFNAGTSTVVINNANATASGNTRFHNLTINNGKKLTIQASSIDTIGGVLTNNGTFDAGTHVNTIVFAGSNQTIPQPNGNTSGYQNLTIAQSSGTAVASEPLTVRGNFGVNSGTFNMSNNALEVKGNFTNNASVSNTPNVTLSGTNQQIEGTSVTTFGDLTLTSGAGTTTLLQDIVVTGTLDVNTGETINASDKNIELTSSGSPWVLNGTFTPGNSTVKYSASGATNVVGTTYYNLQSTGNATKTAQGNVTVNNQLNLNASTIDMQSHTLSLVDLTTSNSGKITADNATVNLNNTAELTLPSGIFTTAVKDLNLNGADVTSSGNITMNGTLNLVGGNLEMGSNTLTMEPTSTWTRTNGKLDASNAKVVFKSPVFAVGVVDNALVKDLEFDRADGIGVNGNLEVSGELKLTAGVVDIAANTLKVNGTMSHSSGRIDADNGRMNFANNTRWDLPATFFNGNVKELEISGNGGIGLGGDLRISDVLDLTSADIVANTNVVEIGTGKSNPGVVNVNQTSNVKVVGKMRRWYNGQVNADMNKSIFPVGSPDDNRLVQINFNDVNDGGYLEVEYILGAPGNNYDLPLTYYNSQGLRRYIQNADRTGYWSITPYDENGDDYASMDDVPYTIKLRINNPSATANGNNLPDPPTMRVIRAKGNPDAEHDDWTIGSEQATISALTSPSNTNFDYLVTATLTGFSWFNIGGDNSTPLPVELLSFSGNCSDNGNLIKWRTASENNSAYFEIQRSRDGEFWTSINQTPAAGFSMQELAYEFEDMSAANEITYYRLKQVDISGDFKIYDPIAVACGVEGNVSITYPNPSAEMFTVLIQQPELIGKANIQILDSRGTVVKNTTVQIEEGINQIRFSENFAPGIYYITITNGKAQSPVLKHSIK